MKQFKSSDLKTILHSKRANLYYLEYCRVLVNSGRVEYVTDEGKHSLYWNIPIANTTSILLGSGTSITQAAMRELSKAGVLVGFCGGGGTPLYNSSDGGMDILWMSPQSEYRPTEYLQAWFAMWTDDDKRLSAAKTLQILRADFIEKCWLKKGRVFPDEFGIDKESALNQLLIFRNNVAESKSSQDIFSHEAHFTKQLYKLVCQAVNTSNFVREKRGKGLDPFNKNLDFGNYLAYGLGATATWVLGIPHGLSVLHGKTRRGGLVFDAADLVKDALVLPQAFMSASEGESRQQFKDNCIENFLNFEALDYIIDGLKKISSYFGP